MVKIVLGLCLVLLPFFGWAQANLKQGATIYMNYCSGCHSLNYLRYKRMATDLSLDESFSWFFAQGHVDDPIMTALAADDAKQWFGAIPPDLSLIAKSKGTAWLTAYLTGFYNDNTRPFGVNNYQSPNIAMPNITASLNKQQVRDLVAFLEYSSEPSQLIRYKLGFWVVSFLSVLFLLMLALEKITGCKKKLTCFRGKVTHKG